MLFRSRLLSQDFERLQSGERIIPEDALDRYKELKTAIDQRPTWRERLLPECLLAALHRFHATNSINDASNAIRERAKLERELRAAIGTSEFRPSYQPVVDLATGTVTGYEMLARWHRRDGDEPARARCAADARHEEVRQGRRCQAFPRYEAQGRFSPHYDAKCFCTASY